MNSENNDENQKAKPTILIIEDGRKGTILRKAIIELIEQEQTNKHDKEHDEEER